MEKMKMMLVDDEERFLATTQKLLAKKGYDVVTASGGVEALEKIRVHNIHVVILDVKMPGTRYGRQCHLKGDQKAISFG